MRKTILVCFVSIFLFISGCKKNGSAYPRVGCPSFLYDISDMEENFSARDKSFVRFCVPKLEKMEKTDRFRLAFAVPFRGKDDPPHKLNVQSYSLNQLPLESFIYQKSTDCRHVTYWSTNNQEYFVLISGGCIIPKNKLYGPFMYYDDWMYVGTQLD